MAAIGTLLLALCVTILGIQGFRQRGFLVSREWVLQGWFARWAGTAALVLSVPLWYLGCEQLIGFGHGIRSYFARIAQQQEAQREMHRSHARQKLLKTGGELYQAKSYQAALKTFAECLAGAEKDQALVMRARCHHALGDFEQALQELDEAAQGLHVDTKFSSQLYLLRGYTHYRFSHFEAALDDFDVAVREAPSRFYGEAARGFRGWMYATCPDEKLRNFSLAAADAEQMPRFVRGKDWTEIEQLAAILAVLGQWEDAVDIQREVVDEIRSTSNLDEQDRSELLKAQQDRLQLYRREMPYHETQPTLELRLWDETLYY